MKEQFIFVAEDDEDDLRQIVRDFDRSNFDVKICTFTNGRELLDALAKGNPPVCILLDMGMPVLDGFQVLKEMHANPKLSDIPVFTMCSNELHRGLLSKKGACPTAFLYKPVGPIDTETACQAVGIRAFSRRVKKSNG